jgi:hypothetical protein
MMTMMMMTMKMTKKEMMTMMITNMRKMEIMTTMMMITKTKMEATKLLLSFLLLLAMKTKMTMTMKMTAVIAYEAKYLVIQFMQAFRVLVICVTGKYISTPCITRRLGDLRHRLKNKNNKKQNNKHFIM